MKKNMKKTLITIFAASVFLFSLVLVSCDALQDTLHDEMQKDLDEKTGIASISGDTWYFDGCATDNVSGSTGTSLLVTFNKKVAIGADSSGKSKLSGSMTITYNSTSGEKKETYKISSGKIKYLQNSDSEYEGEELGALNASANEYRIDMTPAVKFLTGKKALGNELTVELKLSGFVCDEGDQKGRDVGALSKRIKIKPLYEKDTLEKELSFYTFESTLDKPFVIPTLGKVSLVDENDFTIEVTGDSSIKQNKFFIDAENGGLALYYIEDLKEKEFIAKITINGIVPAASGSSYSRTFSLKFIPREPVVKTAEHIGTGEIVQLFTKEDMSVYDDYDSLVFELTWADWKGSQNNWWSIFCAETEDKNFIGGNETAVWSGETASLEIPSEYFESIKANGIYIKADSGCSYKFKVTYK